MVRIYGTFILSDNQTEKGKKKSLLYLIIREVIENNIKALHFILLVPPIHKDRHFVVPFQSVQSPIIKYR